MSTRNVIVVAFDNDGTVDLPFLFGKISELVSPLENLRGYVHIKESAVRVEEEAKK